MSGSPITHFDVDPQRIAAVSECMENYDVGSPNAEWPNNIISRKTVIYTSGRITKQGDIVRHVVDPNELELCKQLSAEAASLMTDVDVGMGSESGDPFHPFFIVANVDDPAPIQIDDVLIRRKFADTIFPPAIITVEELKETGVWWSEVEADGAESPADYFDPWRRMITWFNNQALFRHTAFVRIGDADQLYEIPKREYPKGTKMTGCVLPRLPLGLTRAGSLIGLFGYSVQT